MTALLLAVAILAALCSGPAWMAVGRKQAREEIQRWNARRP